MNSNHACTVFCLTSLLLVLVALPVGTASAQIYYVAELNTEQIQALDREKTVVLLPGGILEQHGPYLPSFADGYMSQRLTQDVAEAIVARPGWAVLVFPQIPLGTDGANYIGGKYVFPGSYAVRSVTLRAVFMDLATSLGGQGFRWIFVLHVHGAPNQHRALDQVGDYFRDMYGGHMVHLFGLIGPRELRMETQKFMSEEEQQEEGFGAHGDMNETSRILFLRPELVNPAYKNAIPQAGRNIEDLIRIARAKDWPGYFGSPRLARADFGAQAWKVLSSRVVELALRILDGLDYRQLSRWGDIAASLPSWVTIDEGARAHECEVERKQQEWLRKKGLQSVTGEKPEPEADVAAVKKVREQAVAAQNAGDFEAFSAVMADDIIFMPPNAPAVIGKEGLRALWAVRWAPFRHELTLHHDEVIVAGDWAIHRGRIIGRRIRKAGGEPDEVKRKAIDILRRQPDGSWKHARISTNDDLPASCSTPR